MTSKTQNSAAAKPAATASRRKFLTAATGVAAGGATLGFPMIAKAQTPIQWKMTSAYAKGAPFYMDGPGSATDVMACIASEQRPITARPAMSNAARIAWILVSAFWL